MKRFNAKRAVLYYRLSRALAIVRMRRVAAWLGGDRQRAALERLRREEWK
jgi:hypothetical protein